ncbi:sulfotransferase [Colwellia sp. MB02u-10]|uniref:tetratricopeptide repeat-containing sulfotransferase family protein n=1 Tax=Colwellia sp. MB02u-10 TaxID=2759828 RepID=UPI0015F3C227|nr:tetratricopeptide repeat-containing sulfotransferase family protein [Colwellia sp. MB02u-10]MBA6341122.1 sulfotransferase [Colwellia sp. MB02u-10]
MKFMTPLPIDNLIKLAQTALETDDFPSAHKHLLEVLKQDRGCAEAFFLLAMIPLSTGNIDKAIELINRAIKISPDNSKYIVYLAKCFTLKGDVTNGLLWAERLYNVTLTSAILYDTLGVVFSRIGLHEKAKEKFSQAIHLDDYQASFYFNLASSLKYLGDFNGARNAYEKSISLEPNFCKAHTALTSLGGITQENNHITRLVQLRENANNHEDFLYLSHALATEYEALNDYTKAFTALDKAKKRRIKEVNYDFSEDEKMFSAIKETFSTPELQFQPGHHSDQAIFVVGMPRTGTTLVERILSGHHKVNSVGELHSFELLLKEAANLPHRKLNQKEDLLKAAQCDLTSVGEKYIKSTLAISGECEKFVDKLPLNILNVGFILKALPKSKIVCLERNPLDTIVSNYRQIFSLNYDYCYYSNDLTSTAKFYAHFIELMKFWQKQFPDNFMITNYEKLVNDPEHEAKKIMKFCQLDWQKQCLNIQTNPSPVSTASAVQVRQPISNKSIGNWKKYDFCLDEVKKIITL